MGNYYAADFDPWVNNIRRIGTMLAQMPERRALMAERQQFANLREVQQQEAMARTGEYDASTRKLNAEADATEGENAGTIKLQDALKRAAMNPNDKGATSDAQSEMANFFRKNPEQAAKAVGQLASQFLAQQGSTNFAQMGALQGNAASIANNQANNERIMATPMNVPDNNIAIDKTTGNTIAAGLQRVAPGQQVFAPSDFQLSYETKPAVSGPPAPPKTAMGDAIKMRTYANAVQKDAENGTTNAPTVLRQLNAAIPSGNGSAPQQGATAAKIPALPADPTQRQDGQTYQGATGPVWWDAQNKVLRRGAAPAAQP